MRRAGDNLILQRLAQVAEIVAVTGHAHDQAAVLFRVFLRGPQRFGIDHVELDMMPVQVEIAAHQVDKVIQPFVVR
jgi:hypothetical protein